MWRSPSRGYPLRTLQLTSAFIIASSSASAALIPATLHGIYARTAEQCRVYEKNGAMVLKSKDHLYIIVHKQGFSTYWETVPVVQSRGSRGFEARSGDTPATLTRYLLDFTTHDRLRVTLVGADGPETLIRCRDPV